ncbi:MAG: rod shape-determining protein MreD [Bacteroidetes bacterium]|nr:rod shape-determining protein MreD [Bacteroidota bacterium]
MLNRNSILKTLLYFLLLAILQLSLVPFLSVKDAVPDLILIFLVYQTLLNGQIYGTVAGCLMGLFFDLFSGGLVGGYMFSKTLTGFVVGYIYNENKLEVYTEQYWFVFIVLLAGVLDSFIHGVILPTEVNMNFITLFFNTGLLPGLYTAAIATPFLLFKKRKGLT